MPAEQTTRASDAANRRRARTNPLTSGRAAALVLSLSACLGGETPSAKREAAVATAIADPIPSAITASHLVVGLKLVAQLPASSIDGALPRTRITKLDYAPRTGRAFVLDLRGKLYELRGSTSTVYLNLARLKPGFIEAPGLGTGFGSFAFHPDFAENGLLYTTHSEAPGSGRADFGYADSIKVKLQWVLSEWKAAKPTRATFFGTSRELLRVNMVSEIHGVQEIAFNPASNAGAADHGLLYIGVGDGGSVENGFPFLARSRTMVWGTILRIDPLGSNSANAQYGVPPDNPFAAAGATRGLGELYAYGFRNPHRITWSTSGDMLVPNIGQGNIESLDLIAAGHDYGWPIREGTFSLEGSTDRSKVYPLPANDSVQGVTYPVAQYDHDGKVAAISGGFEYRGTAIPQLAGKYLFGDIPTGRLLYVNMADLSHRTPAPIHGWRVAVNGVERTLRELCGADRVDLHFGRDQDGALYLLTKPDGKVYKLVSATLENAAR